MPSPYAFNTVDLDDIPHQNGALDGSVGSAPQQIASKLRELGLNAPASLYDEALKLARDGHLGRAISRLQMVLCMDPEDAEALLLLAQIHATQNQPEEALKQLDAAVNLGAVAPPDFRELLESAIQARINQDEELRNRIAARDQGELRGLRAEAKQLRADLIRVEQDVQEALRRERTWKMATVGVALFATGVVLALMILPPATTPEQIAAIQAGGSGAAVVDAGAGAAGAGAAMVAPTLAPTAEAPAPAPTAEVPAAEPPPVAPAPAAPAAATASVAPAPAPTAEAPAPAPTPKATPKAPPAGRVHVVAKGDTLGSIAVRYYGSLSGVKKIQEANAEALQGGDKLKLGMKLKIP